MKEEALKLADDLEELHEQDLIDGVAHLSMPQASAMIRRLVEELDKQGEPVAWFDGKYLICPELGYEYTITTEHPKTLGWKPLYTTPQTKPLERTDVYGLAMKAGFMLSTQYGQADGKMMPATDGETLMAFVKAIEERQGIK